MLDWPQQAAWYAAEAEFLAEERRWSQAGPMMLLDETCAACRKAIHAGTAAQLPSCSLHERCVG